MSSDHDQPAAKRIRLDDAPAAPEPTAPSTPTSSSSSNLISSFFRQDAPGLFGVLAASLGKRAATEEEVGITRFIAPEVEPFSAIIKHRFTDFLVYEVGLDGEVVRLKAIDGPGKKRDQLNKDEAKPDGAASSAPVDGATTSTAPGKVESGAPDAAPASSEPAKVVDKPVALWNETSAAAAAPLFEASPTKLDEFKAFIEAGPGSAKDKRTFVSDPIPDKALRGTFHKTLREAFSSKLVSAHKENEGGEPSIEVAWVKAGTATRDKKQKGAKGERVERPDLSTLPPYIHFTLLKANKESHDALSTLSRYFNLTSTRDLGMAGTKDKRAVTVQRVSLKRSGRMQTADDVWRAARTGGGGGGGRGGRGGAWGGGGGFIDRNIRIGDVGYGDSALELGQLAGNKFVVTLRDVKTPSVATLHASMSAIRAHGFVNYYGMQRFGTAPVPTHAVGLALLRGEWALAAELILSSRDGEHDDMLYARHLWREGKVGEAARAMPRRAVAERCLLESYQRNGVTNHLGAISTIPKNLRLMYVHAWQSYIWNRVVSERVKLFGAKQPVEGDLVYADGEGAEDEPPSVEEDGTVAVEGADVEAPSEEAAVAEVEPSAPTAAAAANPQLAHFIATSKVRKVRALTADDIKPGAFTIYDVVLPMPGFAVSYPAGELGDVYKRVIREDGIDPDDMWRKQKEYSLGGAYRKIVHLPKDVTYRLLVSTSPNEDLAQSDEDALLGRAKPAAREYRDEDGPLGEGESLAMQVELTLGSSTYATMALREVLKSRTSAANQKSLTQQMEARLEQQGQAQEQVPAQAEAEDKPEPMQVEEAEEVKAA